MPELPAKRGTNGLSVDSVTSVGARSLDARVHTEPPDRYRFTPRRDEPDPAPERRIFCAAATGSDYALLSPSVRRYGYGAPQRRLGSGATKSGKGPPSTSYRHLHSRSTTYLIAADPDIHLADAAT